MADLYYIEEDYYNPSLGYFVYTADAAAAPSSQFTVSCDATTIAAAIEASASLVSEFSTTPIIFKISNLSSNVNAEFSQSSTVIRIRESAVSFSSQVSQTTSAGKILEATINIDALFSPSVTADAFKNHTAILDVVFTTTTVGVANRSTSIATDTIANLNAQAAKTVDIQSSMATAFSQATQVIKLTPASSNITSAFTVSVSAENVQLASAGILATSTVTTSRYLGIGRPRNLPNPGGGFSSSLYKFGSYGWVGSDTVGVGNSLAQGTIPKLNQDFVFETWFYKDSSTLRNLIQWVASGPTVNPFIRLSHNTNGTIRFRRFYDDQTTGLDMDSSVLASATWHHILIVKNSTNISFFVNGSRVGTSTVLPSTKWSGFDSVNKQYTINATNHALDEMSLHIGTTLGYDPTATTITVPTSPRVNDPVYTTFLYHFENSGQDDISVTQAAASALSSATTVTAQFVKISGVAANLTSAATLAVTVSQVNEAQASLVTSTTQTTIAGINQSAAAALAALFTQSASATRIQSADSTINSQASVSALVGLIVSAQSLLTAASTQTTVVLRTRTNVIAITSAFTPTLTADVYKNHVASLTATTALAATISKTLNAASELTTAATQSATAIKLVSSSAGLSSQVNLTALGGKLKPATANITGAFNATISVQYFEGTSLMVAAAATMSVSAVKTARITRTLSSAATLTATAFNAVHDPGPLPVPHYRSLFHFNEASNYVESYGGTHSITGSVVGVFAGASNETAKFGARAVANPTSPYQAVISTAATGYGNVSFDFWWRPYADFRFGELNNQFKHLITWYGTDGFQDTGEMSLFYKNRDSGTTSLDFRLNGQLVSVSPVANRGPIPGANYDPYISTQWHHVAVQRTNTNIQLFFNGQLILTFANTPIDLYNKFLIGDPSNPFDGYFDELRIYDSAPYSGNFTPQTSEYPTVIEYYNEKNGYALLESRASLAALAFTVVFQEVTIVQGQFTSSTQGSRIRFGVANITASSTLTAQATKTVRGAVALASAFATTNRANRIKQFAGALAATTSLSATGSTVRIVAAQLASEFALSVDADKRTGIVVSMAVIGSITADNVRIRNATTAFTSIATNLIAAFKNATGTILLESSFTSSTQAQKITSPPQSMVSAFTQTATVTKIARGTANITATVTMTVVGVRIRSQAAELSSSLTLVITTTNSKLVRTASAMLVETSQTTLNTRTRSISKTLTSTATVTCVFQVIITASAALTSQFTGLFIFGKRVNAIATLQSQGFQVTAGDIINFEPSLTYLIPQETRELEVRRESREYIIEQETRQLTLLEG